MGIRAADIRAVIDKVEMASSDAPELAGADLRKLIAAGHSAGGAAAIEAARLDGRITAVVDIDGMPRSPAGTQLTQPLLAIVSGDMDPNPGYEHALDSLLADGNGARVTLNGVAHSPSPAPAGSDEDPCSPSLLVPVRDRPLEREGDQGRIEGLRNLPHGRIARRRHLTSLSVRDREAMQRGDTWPWPSVRQPFDERDRLGRGSADTIVGSRVRVEGCDAAYPVELAPALKRPSGDPGLSSEDSERNLIFDLQPKNTPPPCRIHESPTRWCSRAPRGPADAGTDWPGSTRQAAPHPRPCGPSPSLR